MNWNTAHRVASIAAVQAHRDLGIDRSDYVPIHAALGTAGLTGLARPMPTLFGVYRSPADDGPAVLLNANLNVITQRHTAAHELGHHRLGHHSAYDKELDRSAQWGNGSWPDEEKLAEAFAAWFLMPRPAVLAALGRIAGQEERNPEHAYLLARALGTSYAGTVRHLIRLSLLEKGRGEQWLRIAPAALRRSLAGGVDVPARAHVHAITAGMDSGCIYVEAGDLLAPRLPFPASGPLPRGVVPRPRDLDDDTAAETGLRLLEVSDELDAPATITFGSSALYGPVRVTLCRESPRKGIDALWPT